MQKYRVTIHGQNLLTEVTGVRQKLGFFAPLGDTKLCPHLNPLPAGEETKSNCGAFFSLPLGETDPA